MEKNQNYHLKVAAFFGLIATSIVSLGLTTVSIDQAQVAQVIETQREEQRQYSEGEIIFAAKQRLSELGFYTGEIDTNFDDSLVDALTRYQDETIYLKTTGKLDAETQSLLLDNVLYPSSRSSVLNRGEDGDVACDVIYMAGGHSGIFYSDFYYFDGDEWTYNGQPLWTERGYPIFITFQGKIWIIGGSNNGGSFNDVWVFDPSIGVWEEFDNDPIAPGIQNAPWNGTTHFDGVVYDGKIWFLTTNFQLWSFDGTSWELFDHQPNTPGIQNAPFGIGFPYGYELTVYDNKIWKIGGGLTATPNNSFWSFDGTSWTKFDNDPNTPGIQDPPWGPRWEHETIVYDGKLWLMGGYNSGTALNDVWIFDGVSWEEFDNEPNFPGVQTAPWSPRWEFAIQEYDGKIWLMAGSTPFKNDVWYFDGTSWTQFDHEINTPGMQNAPWSPRDGLMLLHVPCQDLNLEKDAIITKEVSSLSGNQVSYTITVENVGNVEIENVVVTDDLGVGMTYLSHTAPPGVNVTFSGNDVFFEIPTMAPGEILTFTVNAIISVGTCEAYINTASVDFDGFDINPGNNTSTTQTVIQKLPVTEKITRFIKNLFKKKTDRGQLKYGVPCPTDLGIEKEFIGAQNNQAEFLITLTNYGPNSSPFWISDNVSNGLSIVSATSSDPSVDTIINGSNLVLSGEISIGDSVTFTVIVDLPNAIPSSGYNFSNEASVSATGIGTEEDLDPSNDEVLVDVFIPGVIFQDEIK